jgi:hypothetical protein
MDRVHGVVDQRHSWVHSGPLVARTLGAPVPYWRAGARDHRSSPTVAKGDEGDEVVWEGRSSEHERW